MSVAVQTTTASAAADKILSVNNIEVIYDHVILVLKGVSLEVPKGGIVALLGANGAGKTTTLKAISNLLHAERGDVTKGSIVFEGGEVQDLTPNELVRRGCIQVMEGRHCFGHLRLRKTSSPARSRGEMVKRRSSATWILSIPISQSLANERVRSPATLRAASSKCAPLAVR